MTSAAQRVHEATPASRNRVVDFLRAAAITVVVFGHWTIAAVYVEGGGILPHGVLEQAPWTHPLTWVFQVMPIFFLVGGYSNGLSWRSARRNGTAYSTWLRARLRRLGIPLIPLLVFWMVAAAGLLAAGVPADTLRVASQVALVPTWFLAAYLMVVAIAPPCLALWERFGWWSIAGGIAIAAVVDAISILAGNPLLGYPNYVLVWASFHQFGYAWLDGRLDGARRRLTMTAIGAVALLLAIGLGPYPVSMIGLEGEVVNNSFPTRITMAFLGMAQCGLVLLAEHRLAAWLQRPWPWYVTVLINQRIMSWYLWHLTAMVCVVGISMLFGGVGLHIAPLTTLWWVTRPLWWTVLLAATVGFVSVVGRFESPAPDNRPAPAAWRPILAAVAVVAGVAVMANVGIVTSAGVAWIWPLLPVLGMIALGVVQLRVPTRA